MLFTRISPNTERDDIALALWLCCTPRGWRSGAAAGGLEQDIGDYLGRRRAVSVSCGRTALCAILEALGIGPGHEVLVQAFTCVAVPGPVLWRGATPVYVDCEPETLGMSPADLRKKITPASRAVIIQHTFGIPARLDELLAVAREHALFVIEDCAHALGATYRGKRVGTFGDASFFSFGRDKVISSVFGGVATTDSDALAQRLMLRQSSYPYPSRLWTVRQTFHPLFMWVAKKAYPFFGLGRLILGAARALRIVSRAVEPNEYTGGAPSFFGKRMPNALALMARNQFRKLERLNAHRRAIAACYRARLPLGVQVAESRPYTEPLYLRFPIFVENPNALIAFARSRAIELDNWYASPVAPEAVELRAVNYRACPAAEALCARVCNLPTGIQITLRDAERISDVVNGYLVHED